MQKTTYEESISPKKSRLYGAIRGLKRRAKRKSPAKGGFLCKVKVLAIGLRF